MSKRILIIDAGHGSLDPQGNYTTTIGKFFVHKQGTFHKGRTFYEGVYNRQVAAKLIELCKKASIPFKTVYHDFEDWGLNQRTALANRIAADNGGKAALVSIHGNAFTNTAARGMSVHIFTNPSVLSMQLGDALGSKLFQTIKETPFRKATVKEMFWRDNFAMVRQVSCPAVLSENGFFTNYADACLMMTDDFQYRVAQAHLDAFNLIS